MNDVYETIVKSDCDSDNILGSVGERVTKENQDLAKECIDKMHLILNQENAVGIAAQQLGYKLNIFTAKLSFGKLTFINPTLTKIKPSSYTRKYREGCLSIPNVCYETKRCSVVKVRYQDEWGKWNERRFKDQDAVIISHEYDHINGIILSDWCEEMIPESKEMVLSI